MVGVLGELLGAAVGDVDLAEVRSSDARHSSPASQTRSRSSPSGMRSALYAVTPGDRERAGAVAQRAVPGRRVPQVQGVEVRLGERALHRQAAQERAADALSSCTANRGCAGCRFGREAGGVDGDAADAAFGEQRDLLVRQHELGR